MWTRFSSPSRVLRWRVRPADSDDLTVSFAAPFGRLDFPAALWSYVNHAEEASWQPRRMRDRLPGSWSCSISQMRSSLRARERELMVNDTDRATLAEVNRELSQAQARSTSGTAAWEQQWEADPTVWQNLDEETPYGDPSPDRMGQYEDGEFLSEFPTVAEAMLGTMQFRDATALFGRYLRAMVLTRHSQMAPDRVEPVGAQEFKAMSPAAQVAQGEKLQALAQEVFDWMRSQGMDPMPGHERMPVMMNEEVKRRMLAQSG